MSSKKAVVAEVELSRGLVDTINSLARSLEVSSEEVLTSSVKLMKGVYEGRYRVTEANGVEPGNPDQTKR